MPKINVGHVLPCGNFQECSIPERFFFCSEREFEHEDGDVFGARPFKTIRPFLCAIGPTSRLCIVRGVSAFSLFEITTALAFRVFLVSVSWEISNLTAAYSSLQLTAEDGGEFVWSGKRLCMLQVTISPPATKVVVWKMRICSFETMAQALLWHRAPPHPALLLSPAPQTWLSVTDARVKVIRVCGTVGPCAWWALLNPVIVQYSF